jgi:hypothetical protein
MKLINSAAYEDISDFKILYLKDLEEYIKNGQILKSNGIIYCKTDFISILFNHLRFSSRSYSLITHHSDYSIDKTKFESRPKCIKKWYAINTTYEHSDLISIPLGTKTPENRAYHESQYKIKWLEFNLAKLQAKPKIQNVVYCNWTDTNEYRKKIIQQLKQAKIDYVLESNLSFTDYCERLAEHQFIISPIGNGLDNHRTWESLSVHSFPIVITNPMYDKWQNLPIIQVKDYSYITKELLLNQFIKKYNFELTNFEYWKTLINKNHETNFR